MEWGHVRVNEGTKQPLMVHMLVEDVFTSAGVNQRSHCLAACRKSNHFVFASDGQVVVETFPGLVLHTCKRHSSLLWWPIRDPGNNQALFLQDSRGHIVSVSDRHHKTSITQLKWVSRSFRDSSDIDQGFYGFPRGAYLSLLIRSISINRGHLILSVSVITDVTMDDRAMMGIQYRNFEILLPARGEGAIGVSSLVDLFLSGGADGRVVLYEVNAAHPVALQLITIERTGGSIGALCGTCSPLKLLVTASWVVDSKSVVRVHWLKSTSDSLTVDRYFDITDLGTALILDLDMQIMPNGKAILAMGTTKRFVELYCETQCENAVSKLVSLAAHDDWVHSIAFNQSFPVLMATAGQDSYVKLWRIEEEEKDTDPDEICVTKNRFTIGDANNVLCIGTEAVLDGHNDWVHSTWWDDSGQILLTSSSDKTVIVWKETYDGKLWSDTVRLGIVGGPSGFYCAVFSPDNQQIVASSYFGGLYSWVSGKEDDVWNGAPVCSGHVGAIRDIAWHPQGRFLYSVGEDKTTRVYALEKEQQKFAEVGRPQVHGHSMQCIAVVSRSVIVTGAEEKVFRVFQTPETFGKTVCNITGFDMFALFGRSSLPFHGARVPALGLSNKAIEDVESDHVEGDTHWEEVAFQANPSVLHAPPTEDCLQQNTLWPEIQKLYGHGHEVYAVAINPSGTVLATSCKASQPEDAMVALWDTSDWSKKADVSGHQLTVTQLQWSPDGTRLLSVGRDRKAVLYRERNGDLNGFCYEKYWSSNREHTRIIWSCCWFDDAHHFTTVSRDTQVIVWRCSSADATLIHSLKCPQPATAVAVCCGTQLEDSIISIGLQDGSILFANVVNDRLQSVSHVLIPKFTVDSPINRIRLNPVNRFQLAVGGSDGKLRLLQLSQSE